MTKSSDKLTQRVRVANFTDSALPFENVLNLPTENIDAVVTRIRQYADLPFVYLVCDGKQKFIAELLSKLASIRSPCYPYALFLTDGAEFRPSDLEMDIISTGGADPTSVVDKINTYAISKFTFDPSKLQINSDVPLPDSVDVMIVGAGVTGLFAANYFKERNISFCIAEKRDAIGGIWSLYANSTSQVNTSEGAYRLVEPEKRSNRDHSATGEILEDLVCLAHKVADRLYLETNVDWVEKNDGGYQTTITRNQQTFHIQSKGVILAINDRVGSPREVEWKNQKLYKGKILRGISNETDGFDWTGKKVAIVGMGAFAIENTRTALVGGASEVTVICRRHGTICPKIIDYLNFSSPYDAAFKHEKKSNMRNMMLWKKLYDRSGATAPECWMGKVKHEGHTISVSDIWFIGHYLKKIRTVAGSITDMYENGVVVNDQQRIDADVLVNCVGFHRNAVNVKEICAYRQMYNNNYVDKDLMYLADAYLDDDVFNSFFGSSVLEMAKFYLAVFVKFFDSPEFESMLQTEGIEKISIEERSWSHYIAGANALIRKYPDILAAAQKQIAERTRNFMEVHDIETFIAENKREWIDTHSLLAGERMKEEDCLPYLFDRLAK